MVFAVLPTVVLLVTASTFGTKVLIGFLVLLCCAWVGIHYRRSLIVIVCGVLVFSPLVFYEYDHYQTLTSDKITSYVAPNDHVRQMRKLVKKQTTPPADAVVYNGKAWRTMTSAFQSDLILIPETYQQFTPDIRQAILMHEVGHAHQNLVSAEKIILGLLLMCGFLLFCLIVKRISFLSFPAGLKSIIKSAVLIVVITYFVLFVHGLFVVSSDYLSEYRADRTMVCLAGPELAERGIREAHTQSPDSSPGERSRPAFYKWPALLFLPTHPPVEKRMRSIAKYAC